MEKDLSLGLIIGGIVGFGVSLFFLEDENPKIELKNEPKEETFKTQKL